MELFFSVNGTVKIKKIKKNLKNEQVNLLYKLLRNTTHELTILIRTGTHALVRQAIDRTTTQATVENEV